MDASSVSRGWPSQRLTSVEVPPISKPRIREKPEQLGHFERAHHAARGSGEHRANGMPPRFLGRHEAAVRLHDRDPMAARALQFGEIFVHQRTDVGVDQRG